MGLITIDLVGKTPLLMHNPRMVDPEFDICRQIKAIAGKRKKTDEDLRLIARLEWHGGLYSTTNGANGSSVVAQPTANVRKCLTETAKVSKLGKALERALSFVDLYVPLIYDGPKDFDALFADPRFQLRLPVGVGGRRVMRVRPHFFPWAVTLNGLFIEDAGVNLEDLHRIIDLAGVGEGLGDNRRNGYGRFMGKVIAR
jgi:hypothetical protein